MQQSADPFISCKEITRKRLVEFAKSWTERTTMSLLVLAEEHLHLQKRNVPLLHPQDTHVLQLCHHSCHLLHKLWLPGLAAVKQSLQAWLCSCLPCSKDQGIVTRYNTLNLLCQGIGLLHNSVGACRRICNLKLQALHMLWSVVYSACIFVAMHVWMQQVQSYEVQGGASFVEARIRVYFVS